MASALVDIAVGLSFTNDNIAFGSFSSIEVVDFTLPEAIVELVEVTHQGSTTRKEWVVQDLQDTGAFIAVVHHHQDFDYFADVGKSGALVLTLPSTATMAFTGLFVRYTPQGSTLNDKMVAEMEFKINSAVTVVAAS